MRTLDDCPVYCFIRGIRIRSQICIALMQYYVTAQRLDELKRELHRLKTDVRREIADRLKQAKEYGDLSENSEYAEARERQQQVEMRIAELGEIIKNAVVIRKKDSGDVEVGSRVTVRDGIERTLTFEIVGSNEADPEAGKISNESPLGRMFLGRKVGEHVTVQTPRGEAVYYIVKVE